MYDLGKSMIYIPRHTIVRTLTIEQAIVNCVIGKSNHGSLSSLALQMAETLNNIKALASNTLLAVIYLLLVFKVRLIHCDSIRCEPSSSNMSLNAMSLIVAALVLTFLPQDVSAMIQSEFHHPPDRPSFTGDHNVLEPLVSSRLGPEPREYVKMMVGLENPESRFAVSILSMLPGVMSAHIISRGAGVALLEMSPNTDIQAAMESLGSVPGIRYVEEDVPVSIVQSSATEAPNDPLYGDQYALEKLQMPMAWHKYGHGDGSVVVMVIDTG